MHRYGALSYLRFLFTRHSFSILLCSPCSIPSTLTFQEVPLNALMSSCIPYFMCINGNGMITCFPRMSSA